MTSSSPDAARDRSRTGAPRLPHTGGRTIAILRGGTGDHVVAATRTLVTAGVLGIEITTNTPGWQDGILWAASEYGRAGSPTASVGVGTVLDVAQLEEAAAAGATFAVSPHLDPVIGVRAAELGMAWYPGAATPTEILTAWRLGATAVKVFPIGPLGGPAYLRQVLAPLDFVQVIPTGGIGVDSAADYLAAGAVAVGLGSPLVGDALTSGDMAALAHRARRLVAGL
ncbi:bifunctional 4-hydroxy-2-oxoglutarate aldolase/2-dehydro-3-deoxy-phosphogluconate aldolase [Curtobacterium sp. RRHDQ10]|uniref:bifunctional 4-hydroxy-2-oxoglutarate aldolase/2-dehydro-3-deoxy-phosphogluconate aldolase n=1 Tax=Curtobacterium phyllosphaerae TaxID=3413379 RepID=UPI003BF2C86E